MSLWVRGVATVGVPQFTPGFLRAGIAYRLALLTSLFCPDEEEDPDVVLRRLRVEEASSPGENLVWLLHYRNTQDQFIRLERWQDADAIGDEAEELMELLEGQTGPGPDQVRTVLGSARESIALALTVRDRDSMGWPLAIAAAACFAETGRGLVQADGSGWMRPAGREVEHLVGE
jgi:hypothetical protein